jgi:ribonucleoside-diphosphate reductase alpha chain
MGIFTAEERQRHLETGSYEPAAEEAADEDYEEELESLSQGFGAPTKAKPEVAVAEAAETANAAELDSASAVQSGAGAASARVADVDIHSSADILAKFGNSKAADAPMCMTCGTKMRPAGSCYVCEGCGSTSGCS